MMVGRFTRDGSRRLEIERRIVGESEALDTVRALGGSFTG
jgi:hypothetical protein